MRLIRRMIPIVGVALAAPASLNAQASAVASQWVLGGGSFLTKDGGWNYALGLELSVAREQALGDRFRLHVGTTAWTAPLSAMGGEAAIYPPDPDGLEHAAALSVQVRSHPRGAGLYGLAGVDAVVGHAGNQGGGVRGGASAGIGLNLHRTARFALEGQYSAFTRSFGTTRGVLSIRLVHRR